MSESKERRVLKHIRFPKSLWDRVVAAAATQSLEAAVRRDGVDLRGGRLAIYPAEVVMQLLDRHLPQIPNEFTLGSSGTLSVGAEGLPRRKGAARKTKASAKSTKPRASSAK